MLPRALTAVLLLVAAPAHKLPVNEQRYIEARDAATARFVKGEGPREAEQQAMDGLEARLREIVGPVQVPGLVGPGKLAYEGFWGAGSAPVVADGMVFDWSGNTLFVTTKALYMRAVGALHVRSDEDDMVRRTVLGG